MHLRRAALATTAVLAIALLGPAATAQAATSLKVTYTCTSSAMPDPFPMDIDATVTAVRSGAVVNLEMSMGKPVLPLDDEFEATLASSLTATANGASTTLTGAGPVSFKPNTPVDLPVLTSSVTTPATSLTLVPGALTVKVTAFVYTVPINCTPNSRVSITIPVVDPNTPPTPIVKKAPALKISLTKKTQEFKKAPAKVKVSLGRATGTSANPQGTILVKVGAHKVATKSVVEPRNFKIALPRNLKAGKHKVVVTFTPTKNNAYKRATRTVKIRVTR